MAPTNHLQLPSFAKINWILKILGRRPDGFHELRTVFQTVDLHDDLYFARTAGKQIRLDIEGREVAGGQDNLVWRAAELLRSHCGTGKGVAIRLRKRIPVGAGLGGGSGNAALTLLALDRLWDCGLDARSLLDLASRLGSDVPFFLQGGTVEGRGRGEKLLPLPDPVEEALLILYPGLQVSSGDAYALGRWPPLEDSVLLTKDGSDNTISSFRKRAERGSSVRLLAENDFDAPVLREFPQLQRAKQLLEEAGCERVVLCGSGSALLALGEPGLLGQIAREAADFAGRWAVARGSGTEVFRCRTLSRERYRDILRKSGLDLKQEFVA